MLTPEMAGRFMDVNLDTADMEKQADISALELDNSLQQEKRWEYVIQELENPFCFRFGDMGIRLEFDDAAPPMREVLLRFLIRKKSGL